MVVSNGVNMDYTNSAEGQSCEAHSALMSSAGFKSVRIHKSVNGRELVGERDAIYSMCDDAGGDAISSRRIHKMMPTIEQYQESGEVGINTRYIQISPTHTLPDCSQDDSTSYVVDDDMIIYYIGTLNIGGSLSKNAVVGIYYPIRNTLVMCDIFHRYNNEGSALFTALLHNIKCGSKIDGKFDSTEADMMEMVRGTKRFIIVADKMYTMEPAKITAKENPIESEMSRLRTKYKELAKRMQRKYDAEVEALEAYKKNIKKSMVPMPVMSDRLFKKGYSIIRMQSDAPRFFLSRRTTITVDRIVKRDRSGQAAGMPVKIPDDMKPVIPCVISAILLPDQKQDNKYLVEKVNGMYANPDGTLDEMNQHAHVLSGDVCTGDVRNLYGKPLTIEEITKIIDNELLPALSMFNPNSWYGLRGNYAKLTEWGTKEKIFDGG